MDLRKLRSDLTQFGGHQTLPQGWRWTTLEDICLPVSKVRPRDAPDQSFTYLDITSIDNSLFRVVSPKVYWGKDAPSRARQRVRSGNTLFSTVRTYLKNIALVPSEFDGDVASTGFCVLNTSEETDHRFVFYFVHADEFVSRLNPLQRGTSYPAVRDDDVRAQPIPLPPLPEQHRIVAEIEKHFTRLDAAVAALKRAQANLKRYRAGVLKAACEGKLVPTEAELARAEGRDYEPAGRLLERILTERRARWQSGEKRRRKYKEPAAPDTSNLPDLPEGWVWVTLSQISQLKGGVTKGQRHPKGRSLREIPYLRVANVQRGYLDLAHLKTIEVAQETVDQLRLVQGDILFTEGGDRDKLGRGWIWRDEVDECIHQNHVFRSRLLLDSIRPEIVSWWGNSFGKDFFSRGGKQTTNLASINLSLLAQFPVPIPPLAEQHRIVAEVERRLSVIQQAETAVESSLKRAGRLRQSILKLAFSGRLVPQDSNDEPASVLLERIRAQRAAAPAAAKRRPRRRVPAPSPSGSEPAQGRKPTPSPSGRGLG